MPPIGGITASEDAGVLHLGENRSDYEVRAYIKGEGRNGGEDSRDGSDTEQSDGMKYSAVLGALEKIWVDYKINNVRKVLPREILKKFI